MRSFTVLIGVSQVLGLLLASTSFAHPGIRILGCGSCQAGTYNYYYSQACDVYLPNGNRSMITMGCDPNASQKCQDDRISYLNEVYDGKLKCSKAEHLYEAQGCGTLGCN